jgi:hypothetical protein
VFLEGGVHAAEEAVVFGFEVVVEFAKVGSQVGKVRIDE